MTIHTRPVEPITLHDPQDWTVLIHTNSIMGFGEGDAIEITKPTEVIKSKVGAMGEVAISVSRNPVHALKLRLHQTGAANKMLRSLFYSQLRAQAEVVGVLSCTNRRTGEAWRGLGWISQDADLKIGPEVQTTEWTFGFVVEDSPDA